MMKDVIVRHGTCKNVCVLSWTGNKMCQKRTEFSCIMSGGKVFYWMVILGQKQTHEEIFWPIVSCKPVRDF